MRRLLSAALLTLALAGCSAQTIRLKLTFDTADVQKQSELLQAVTRVIGRRLSRWEGVIPEKLIAQQQSGSTLLTFDVGDAEARTTLVEELLKPFSLTIMTLNAEEKDLPTEAQGAKAGDLYVEEQGWFNFTGITQEHIAWAQSGTDSQGKKGAVRLDFTDEGRTLLADVAGKNPKGIVGLFVRGKLMSKMQMEGKELQREIVIQNIPNALLADIFADDVNVGTHVTFSLPNPSSTAP